MTKTLNATQRHIDRIKDLIYGGRYARKMKTVLDPSNIVKNDSMYVIIANYQ